MRITVTKIQVIRTTVEIFHPQVTLIRASGVLQSARLCIDGHFKIGRQQVTEFGERPNDLVLPPSDRAISRSHCMINYSPFFCTSIPESWVAFLMGWHPRLGADSIVQFLPLEIIRYILLFLKEPRLPLLIDLGSMCGTYVKVSNLVPVELDKGFNFLVGNDVMIEVDNLANCPVLIEQPRLTFEELAQRTFQKDEEDGNREGAPFIVIKVTKHNVDQEETMHTSTYRFTAGKENKQYTIGRSQVCDIQLPENTISRTQCRIVYYQGKWAILDGVENKATVNGTWQSISKSNRGQREPSEPFPITNKTQIKISDTILQVDWD